jgi:hypothetical protein
MTDAGYETKGRGPMAAGAACSAQWNGFGNETGDTESDAEWAVAP